MQAMSEVVLRFSESVLLSSAASELGRHQSSLRSVSLDPAAKPQVVADLAGLKEVDTSTLAVIVQLDRDVRRATGMPLAIRSAPENLVSLARLSSLLPVLRWEDSAIK
jgi:ABC-type transporter Mla MlaB component